LGAARPPPIAVSDDLERKIAALWPDQSDRERVREALAVYARGAHGSERVPLAIVKLCRGSVDRVLSMLEEASLDYRDILLAAEYPTQADALMATMRPGATDADKARFEEAEKRDRQQYEEWLKK
jgi:hypothetical protein